MKRVTDASVRSRVLVLLTKSLGVILSLILLATVTFLLLSKNANQVKTSRYLIAKQDISSQQTITSDMLTFQDFDTDYPPLNGIQEGQLDHVVGKKVLISIQKGDIVSPSMFGASNGNLTGGLANLVPVDKKLVYIKQDDVHTFPPDIQKENTVDIIAINQKNESNNVEVIAEKVIVFDVVHSHENGEDSIIQVGLLLSDSEILRLASKFTQDWKISLSIRPQHERGNADKTLFQVASSESKLQLSPTDNEKKKN